VHAGATRSWDASCLHRRLPATVRDVRTEADVDVHVEDMETAAVARAAARRRVPFSPFAPPPTVAATLGDRGFFAQFLDYYRLAALNAGDVTRAVIVELGRLARDRSARRTCRLLAAHRWRSAAKRIAPNG